MLFECNGHRFDHLGCRAIRTQVKGRFGIGARVRVRVRARGSVRVLDTVRVRMIVRTIKCYLGWAFTSSGC